MLASLATCDPDFPIVEWERVLFRIRLTLNLLWSSRVNHKLCAWAYLYGNYDFNKNPLASIRTRVLIHLEADVRASWQIHGEDGWYVGPSMEHYRCVKWYVLTTRREHDADTISIFSKKIKFPKRDYYRRFSSPNSFWHCLHLAKQANYSIYYKLWKWNRECITTHSKITWSCRKATRSTDCTSDSQHNAYSNISSEDTTSNILSEDSITNPSSEDAKISSTSSEGARFTTSS